MRENGQRHAPAALYPRYPLYRRLGGSQSRSGHRGYRKISFASVGDRTVIQSIVRQYTHFMVLYLRGASLATLSSHVRHVVTDCRKSRLHVAAPVCTLTLLKSVSLLKCSSKCREHRQQDDLILLLLPLNGKVEQYAIATTILMTLIVNKQKKAMFVFKSGDTTWTGAAFSKCYWSS
jgi:hypothetical protein